MNYIFFFRLLLVITIASIFPDKAGAQQKSDTLSMLLDYSRPGVAHERLAAIAGSWDFQDVKRPYVKGVLVRKAIFDGRFYSVEVKGGKLSLPVANGGMKEDNYQSLQYEGFDNPRKMYFTTSINNHIGSDVQLQYGAYDSAAKAFTYQWESELLPGSRVENRRILMIAGSDTYREEYFEKREGQWLKTRELKYSRQVAHQGTSNQ